MEKQNETSFIRRNKINRIRDGIYSLLAIGALTTCLAAGISHCNPAGRNNEIDKVFLAEVTGDSLLDSIVTTESGNYEVFVQLPEGNFAQFNDLDTSRSPISNEYRKFVHKKVMGAIY